MRALIFLVAACVFAVSQAASADTASTQNVQSAMPVGERACSTEGIIPPKPLGPHAISEADYPQDATKLGEQGDVYITFLINEDGTVTDPIVVRSSGSPRLDAASAVLVTRWRYNPARQGESPVSCRQRARVVWRLMVADNSVDADPRYYPPQYREHGTQAETSFLVSLDESGTIISMKVLMSSGDPQLDEAGITFLKSLKFTAAEMSGKAIKTGVLMKVKWSPVPPNPR